MKFFNEIDFKFTDDSSVGLYSKEADDIFHSKTGAYLEAREKFVNPVLDFINKIDYEVNILDVCYGIGYNTKALLNNVDNKIINIDALEFNKIYTLISPLIKDGINNELLKLRILECLINNNIDITEFINVINEIKNNNLVHFFDPIMLDFIDKFLSDTYISKGQSKNNSFLHNIYYNYISNESNSALKSNKYNNITINYYYNDARKSLKETNNTYDVVFLDAFSAQKDPTLWTIDFLSLIKSKMKENSLLVSYSKSTPFRSALTELGFSVGKTFIDNIDMGTIASLNENLIINKLNDYDLKLLKTRSGITYKDTNLNLDKNTILKNREIESASSDRISHTKFLKLYTK